LSLTIYKSSAGSGKTFTLVREYVKLLIKEPNNYRHILAITFTNKATDEMKERIVRALAQLAANSPKAESLAQVLLADPDLKPITERFLQQQAAKALALILHNYAEFSVSTIDSFFQQILRNFAKELKIPVRYEVELDTKAVIDTLVMKLLLDVGHRKEITQWLEEFVFASLDDDKGWKIERQITELSERIFQEDVWENIKVQIDETPAEQTNEKNAPANPKLLTNIGQIIAETNTPNSNLGNEPHLTQNPNTEQNSTEQNDLDNEPHLTQDQKLAQLAAQKELLMTAHYEKLRSLVKKLHATRHAFEEKMIAFGKEGLALIAGYGLTVKDFKVGTAGFFEKISRKNLEAPSATLLKIYAGDTTQWCAKTSLVKNKIDQLIDNGLQDLLIETIAFYDEQLPNYYSAQEVVKNIYIYGLLHEIKDKLIDYRTENSKLLISDTNFILNSIIKGTANTDTFTESDAPFIFEKVGLTYHHIMLDEFQDTSNYQWKNLLPLVQNTLSEQHRALVVGDVKQSIYRWRGGNMNLLLTGLKRDLKPFWDDDTEQELAYNYRSKYEIVRFNNSLFKAATQVLNELPALSGATAINQAYQTVEQQIKKGEGGFVQVQFLPNDAKSDMRWQEIAEQQTLELIDELQASGIKLNQIAILTRRNQDGSQMAKLLGEKGIKVISSESLLLNQSPKIRLLMSLLKFIADQRNVIARAEVLVNYVDIYNNWLKRQTPSAELPPPITNNLHQLYTDHQHPDPQNNLFNTLLPQNLIDNLSSLTKLALYEAVEEIIRHLKLNHEPDAYIQRFQDLVLEHTNQTGNDLRTFLVWWEQNQNKDKCSIIVPKGEDAITIMTVHKAKGLEFPVVIMPYADWSLKPKNGSVLWSKSNQEPYNNMGIIPLNISNRLNQSHFSAPYQTELLDTYLDNMNLLYVAFTRPTDRLYAFTPMYNPNSTAAKTGELNSLHQLLYLALKSPHYATIGQWSDNNTYTYGNNQNNTLTDAETDEVSPLTEYISNDYRQRITIKSESQKFFMLFDNDRSVAIRIGQQVHAVLEKTQTQTDVPNVIRKLQLKGIVNQDDIPTIEQRLHQVFNLPEVQMWFGDGWDKILCERTVMNNSRKKIPDRVMLKGKQAVIVDYKTGEKKDSYFTQVNDYAQILESMGYQVTQKYLLYINEDTAEVVNIV
jgi:ATP-dependent helicase/nuclease subunit A